MEIKIKHIGEAAGEDSDEEYLQLLNLVNSYGMIEKFFRENAETISPLNINPLPHIEDGIITSPSGNSTYFMGNCLIENKWRPMITVFDPRKAHEIKMAGLNLNVDKLESLIREHLRWGLEYLYKKEEIYQTKENLDLRSFSSISDLEKELSTPEEIKRPDNLFEQTKNLERIGERLSGEPEILHDIEDYFRQVEPFPVVRDQIKRILQYVPGIFSEDWKSQESFDKLNEKEKQAYKDIAKNGITQVSGPVIQKVIELGVEYKNKYEIKQNV